MLQEHDESKDSRYIYHNELDKTCFQQDMAYGDFKDFTKGTAFDKILRDKAFNIAKKSKYGGYQRVLASMISKFFDKKTSAGATTIVWSETLRLEILANESTQNKSGTKNENMCNKERSEEISHKPII